MDTLALAGKPARTEISQRPVLRRIEWLLGLLTTLAEARGSDVSAEGMELYAATLSAYPDEDVRVVIERTARTRRAEGEKAWPALGDLVEPLERIREQRQEQRRQAARREREIAEFWRTAPEWMAITGFDEAELLRRFPSFAGTKPEGPCDGANVVRMHARDRRRATVGDPLEAA